MLSVNQFIVLGIVLVFILLAVLYFTPTTNARSRKKSRKEAVENEPDWQAVSLKLEKVIQALRRENAELQKEAKVIEREQTIQKEKYAKLQVSLGQERGWQTKEKSELEKKTQELVALKQELRQIEHTNAVEHAHCLKLERENKEAQEALNAAADAKRELDAELLKWRTQCDNYREEIKGLRSENQKLSEKQEAETWVAKTDFQKLKEEKREVERELEQWKKKAGA